MKAILIVLATLFTFQLQAADVTVTAEDAYPPTLTGSISVDINPQLGNAPYVIYSTNKKNEMKRSMTVRFTARHKGFTLNFTSAVNRKE